MPAVWTTDPSWQVTAAPEGRIAAATAASSATSIVIAERDRRPDPTVSLYGGRKDIGTVSEDVIGVAVSVPLYRTQPISAELAAAKADSSAASAELRRVELELRARAERNISSYGAVRDAWTRWSQSKGTAVAARADLLERLWRAGEVSTADYLIQLKQTLDTALAGVRVRDRGYGSAG